MALEAELRRRVEQSLRELEEITGSLHHVKRLADSQQASADQLAEVANRMEAVGQQFRALQESVGQSGAVLQGAVEAVRAADPAVIIKQVEAVGRSVDSVSGRVDATVQLGESARGEIGALRTTIGEMPGKLDAAARAQAAALERMEKAVSDRIEATGERIEALEKRVGTAAIGAWIAAAMAAGGAIAGVIGLLR